MFALDFGLKALSHPGGEFSLLLERPGGRKKARSAGGGMGRAAGQGMAKGEGETGQRSWSGSAAFEAVERISVRPLRKRINGEGV